MACGTTRRGRLAAAALSSAVALAGASVCLDSCGPPSPEWLKTPDGARAVIIITAEPGAAPRARADHVDQAAVVSIHAEEATAYVVFLERSLNDLELEQGDLAIVPDGRPLSLLGPSWSTFATVVDGQLSAWAPLSREQPAGIATIELEGPECEQLRYDRVPIELEADHVAIDGWPSGPAEVTLALAAPLLIRVPRSGAPELMARTATQTAAAAWMDTEAEELWLVTPDGALMSGPPLGPFEKRAAALPPVGRPEDIAMDGGRGADGVELFALAFRRRAPDLYDAELTRWRQGEWTTLWVGTAGERKREPRVARTADSEAVATGFGDLRVLEVAGDSAVTLDLPESSTRNPEVEWVGWVPELGALASTSIGGVYRRRPQAWELLMRLSFGDGAVSAGFVGRTLVLGSGRGVVAELVDSSRECASSAFAGLDQFDEMIGLGDRALLLQRSVSAAGPLGFWVEASGG